MPEACPTRLLSCCVQGAEGCQLVTFEPALQADCHSTGCAGYRWAVVATSRWR